jgi:hypothetical protein
LDHHALDIGVLFELALDIRDFNRLPPFHFELDRVQSVGVRNIEPALAEFSTVYDQDFVAGRKQVCHRSFHRAGAGRSEHEDVILGAKDLFQPCTRFVEYLIKLRCPMMDHRLCHCQLNLVGNGSRAGRKQVMLDHDNSLDALKTFL